MILNLDQVINELVRIQKEYNLPGNTDVTIVTCGYLEPVIKITYDPEDCEVIIEAEN